MTTDDTIPPLEDMVSRAPCGLLITQPDGLIVRANETFCRWIGYSEQALVGYKHLQDLLTIGGRVFHHTHWGPLLHMQRSLAEVKLDVRHAQGHLVPMLINATRRRHGDREFDELAMLVVTERHKYESELLRARQNAEQALDERRRAEQALQQSRDVLGLAMRGAHMGVWSRDLLTNKTTWSRELEELIGLHRDDDSSDAISQFSDGNSNAGENGDGDGDGDRVTPPGFASRVSGPVISEQVLLSRIHDDDRTLFTDAIENSRLSHTDYLVEFRMLHADGDWRWMEGRGRALYDRQGKALAVHGLVIDITPRKCAEALLKDLNRQLSEADHRKDEFLATLAHELRNPLAPMGNILQLLQQKTFDDPQLRWARDVLERQLRHITHLVDDLLEVSRITQGKLELRKQQVSLADVMTNAVEACSPLIAMSMHTLTVQLPSPDVRLSADPIRLSQMIQNLLNNAAKYTPAGGRITLSANDHDALKAAMHATHAIPASSVAITVRDTGIGIAKEHLNGIFQMFSQLAPALDRSQGGLGIGLSLVKALAELHGGSVHAQSDGANCGSIFTVCLPASPSVSLDTQAGDATNIVFDDANATAAAVSGGTAISEAEAEADSEADVDTEAATPIHLLSESVVRERAATHRILIVDDNEDAASSLAMVLEMADHQVETAFNGTSGLLLAESFKPNVVILDIGLPDINGYEVARTLRRTPWGEHVVLLALTGWGQQQDKRDAANAGFDHHFTKPVDFDGLLSVLSLAPYPRRTTAQKAKATTPPALTSPSTTPTPQA